MPRNAGVRPPVMPAGTAQLAFDGPYCEILDGVADTVECAMHPARLAVEGLLGLDTPIQPTDEGLDPRNALVDAWRRVLQQAPLSAAPCAARRRAGWSRR